MEPGLESLVLLVHGYITLGQWLTLKALLFSSANWLFRIVQWVGTVGTPNMENDPVTTVTN